MRATLNLAKLQTRNFAKVNKKGGPTKVDGVGLSSVSEFWFGDKISVWDRVTLHTSEERKDHMALWFNSTPAFEKLLKENFEKELSVQSKQNQASIDNILLFD